jgi:uncharacterized membrane protein
MQTLLQLLLQMISFALSHAVVLITIADIIFLIAQRMPYLFPIK